MATTSPQVETMNVLYLDYADNPKLQSVFAQKDAGDECTLKFEVTVMSKQPEGVKLAINKVITEGTEYEDDGEIEPTEQEPVMATMSRKKSGGSGPHGRPEQTATNSQEPDMTSYA